MTEYSGPGSKEEKYNIDNGFPGYYIYFNVCGDCFELLDDEELGKVMRAMYNYAQTGKEPETGEIPKEARLVWRNIVRGIDYDFTKYYNKCRLNSWKGSITCDEDKTKEAKERHDKEYDEKHAADYMRTTIFKERLKNLTGSEELKVRLAEAKEEGRAAGKAEQKQLTAEDLPPVPHAAKEPKEGSAVEP